MVVVLLFAGIAAASAYQAIARSRALDERADRRAALAASAARADLALVELAAAERGYVAPGQGIDFWTRKADEALVSARGALTLFGVEADDAAASAQASAALARLDDFAIVDERARAYARSGQRAAASDLIFADGYEILAAARAELASAVSLGHAAGSAPETRDRQVRLASIAALGAVAAIALLLLLRVPKAPEPLVTSLGDVDFAPAAARDADARPPERNVSDDNIGAALDASLEGLEAPSLEGLDDFAPVTAVAVERVERAERVELREGQVPSGPSVSAVADLCVDLARLLDARDLDAVLARAASVLGADGLIVWMTDETGQSMAPALTHGYPSSLVARLGRLATGDDNATAAAWRAQSTQVVDGALAVPLLTNLGCTGVLAIAFREGLERGADTQALARIIAAQLAATISPAETESRRAAGG